MWNFSIILNLVQQIELCSPCSPDAEQVEGPILRLSVSLRNFRFHELPHGFVAIPK